MGGKAPKKGSKSKPKADEEENVEALDEIRLIKECYNEISSKKDGVGQECQQLQRQIEVCEQEVKNLEQNLISFRNYIPKKMKKYPINFGQFYEKNITELTSEREQQAKEFERNREELLDVIEDEQRNLRLKTEELKDFYYYKELREEQMKQIATLEAERQRLLLESTKRIVKVKENLAKEKDRVLQEIKEKVEQLQKVAQKDSEVTVLSKWQEYRSENDIMRKQLERKQNDILNLQKDVKKALARNANLNYEKVFESDLNYLELRRLRGLEQSRAALLD